MHARYSLLHLARTAALGYLVFHFYLYLHDSLSLPFVAVAFAATILAALLLARSALRLAPALLAFAAFALVLREGAQLLFKLELALSSASLADLNPFYFDSNLVPMLAPCFAVWLLTFAALRRPRFIVWEIGINSVLFVALFASQSGFKLSLYPHVGWYALSLCLFVFLEVLVLFLSGSHRTSRHFFLAAIPIMLALTFILQLAWSQGAVSQRGGLIKPTLFRFDFSKYVSLESEIAQSDELVMLFRSEHPLDRALLRRYLLAGYSPAEGFTYKPEPETAGFRTADRTASLTSIPDEATSLEDPGFLERTTVSQEYFYVSFDPSSLIALSYPVEITPLRTWSESSFSRVYSVRSRVSTDPIWDLSDAPPPQMDTAWRRFYTDFGNDEQVRGLAKKIVGNATGYYAQVLLIQNYLLDNYFYSLRPGVASDGNQLHWFLFQSKKGYCTYFAFAMSLLCRSLGIPARVAVGFLVDPTTEVMSFYPVRADMAHAWVEVYFGEYGWIEFDPTSTTVAPGESYEPPAVDTKQLESLIEEIVSNQSSIASNTTPRPFAPPHDSASPWLIAAAAHWYLSLVGMYVLITAAGWLVPLVRSRTASSPRLRTRLLYECGFRLLSASGFRRRTGESRLEWARRIEKKSGLCVVPLVEQQLAAIFSDRYGEREHAEAKRSFRAFLLSLRGRVSALRLVASVMNPLSGRSRWRAH